MMTLAKMVARVEIARIQDAGEIGHPFEPLRGNETEGWPLMTVWQRKRGKLIGPNLLVWMDQQEV